jgi:outer membrane lipoprotein SlyB
MNTIKTVNPVITTHPMVIVAATALTLASAGVIAQLGGWLPRVPTGTPVLQTSADTATLTGASSAPLATNAAEGNPSGKAAPSGASENPVQNRKVGAGETAPKPRPAALSTPPRSAPDPTARVAPPTPPAAAIPPDIRAAATPPGPYASAPVETPRPPPVCRDCGVIESVDEIAVEGSAGPVGAIAGGVVGSIIGNQIGHGSQRTAARLLAMAGGAYAGHQIEKSNKRSVRYETVVRFDDGTRQRIASAERPAWRGGEAVRMIDGQLQVRY